MDLTNKKLIVERKHKKVYETNDCIIKAFSGEHPKSDVFNEALNQARIEETGLNVPKVLAVEAMDDGWAIIMSKKNGKTLKEIMESDKDNIRKYMDIYCEKSDTAKQYVQKWLSIVAAQRLSKHIDAEKELLMQYIDVVDYL